MIFVTGGTGMTGSHLLYELVKDGKSVRALMRDPKNCAQTLQIFRFYSEHYQQLFNQIQWVEGDLLDPFSLMQAIEGAEQVYHCAAEVSFNPALKHRMLRNNIQGTANLVNACLEKGIKKLCHISSIASLGEAGEDGHITENCHWISDKNRSNYSKSKYASENEVWRGIAEGLEAVIVNPSVILGPGNWTKGSPSFFGRIGKGMKFYTCGVTGFVDVRDVVKCMIQLMESPISGERYILNSENLSFQHLLTHIAGELDVPKPSIKANKWMLGLFWRIEKIRCFITRKEPAFNSENAKSAISVSHYSSQKIITCTGYPFKPVIETIHDIATLYKKDNLKIYGTH